MDSNRRYAPELVSFSELLEESLFRLSHLDYLLQILEVSKLWIHQNRDGHGDSAESAWTPKLITDESLGLIAWSCILSMRIFTEDSSAYKHAAQFHLGIQWEDRSKVLWQFTDHVHPISRNEEKTHLIIKFWFHRKLGNWMRIGLIQPVWRASIKTITSINSANRELLRLS